MFAVDDSPIAWSRVGQRRQRGGLADVVDGMPCPWNTVMIEEAMLLTLFVQRLRAKPAEQSVEIQGRMGVLGGIVAPGAAA